MTEEEFAAGLAKLVEAARDAGLDDEAMIAVLADAQAALEKGLT